MINLMLRYNSTNKYFEYSTNEGTSWAELDITGATLLPAGDVIKIGGVTLTTHTAGQMPSDLRNIDGVALGTHAAGMIPADVRDYLGAAAPALVSSRYDASLGAVQSGALDGKLFKSIQYGDITLLNTVGSNTVSLSPTVNAAKSVLIYLGAQGGGTSPADDAIRLALVSGTTVGATRSGTAGDAKVGFCVLEFP